MPVTNRPDPRCESPAKGSRLLGLAHALTELPHTLAAMRAGVLSEWHATLIARETACLSRGDRLVVDHQLCAPRPDGDYLFDGWGDKRLAAETQKAVIPIDPEAVVNRRAKAEADGQGLCEHCNHTKQAPGWTASPATGPPGTLQQIDTELPTGHTIRSTAPAAPTPSMLRPISHGELYLAKILLAA